MGAEIYLIGLGGAGTKIVSEIFEENKDRIPLRGLVVDIDNTILDKTKFNGLTTLPLAYEKGYNEQLQEFYPEMHLDNEKIIPPIDATNTGVGKNRRYARAIFNYNVDKKILPAQEILDRFGGDFAKDTAAKCMLIITSLGGGSGGGMLLDIAKNIHTSLIDRRTHTPIFGIGIMGAKQDVSTHCKASTYATLLELEKSMKESNRDERPFDGFMLLDLDQIISRMSDQQAHPIEQAQLEITTAVRCFVNDFLSYQTNTKREVNKNESKTIDFNDFRSVLFSDRSDNNFTFCTMNVDYTEFPVRDIRAHLSAKNDIEQKEVEIGELKNKIKSYHENKIEPLHTQAVERNCDKINKINKVIQEYDHSIESYNDDLDNLDKRLDDLIANKESMNNEIKINMISQSKYENDLNNVSILNRFLKKDVVNNLKSNIRDYKNKTAKSEQEIKKSDLEIERFRDQKSQITKKIGDLELLRSKAKIDYENAMNEKKNLDLQIGNFLSEISDYEKDINDKKALIDNRKETMMKLKAQLEVPDNNVVRSYPVTINSDLYNKVDELISGGKINIDTIIKSMDDRVFEDLISNAVTPAKYLDLLLHDFKMKDVSVAFGMKANQSLNNLRKSVLDRTKSILAPYTTNTTKILTYPYLIDDEFSIYGYGFFNNISLLNIFSFKKYANEYEEYFKENPDIHAYDIEYWENKIDYNKSDGGDNF